MTPIVDLEVIGSRGSIPISAILDTEFDGDLCLPIRWAVTVGLVFNGKDQVELADGTQKRELVFTGAVRFLNRTQTVRIFLTDSDDALVGTHLLADCRLNIDFAKGKVKLTRKSP